MAERTQALLASTVMSTHFFNQCLLSTYYARGCTVTGYLCRELLLPASTEEDELRQQRHQLAAGSSAFPRLVHGSPRETTK